MKHRIFFLFLLLPFITKAQVIATIAGNGIAGYMGNGSAATACELSHPCGVTVDRNGNVYFADMHNHVIRKINAATRIITTVAGNAYGAGTNTGGFSGDGGPATGAELWNPMGVAFDTIGNFYIADAGNYRIRKVDTSGIITTIGGNGVSINTGDGGPATNASLRFPNEIVIDRNGDLYFSDEFTRIRKITMSTGIVNTIGGNDTIGFSGDGDPATVARMSYVYGIAVDYNFNVYVCDGGNYRIRKIDGTSGIIRTFAGNGSWGYSGDGMAATVAEITNSSGVSVDNNGNVLIADYGNNAIRKVDTFGIMHTVAGTFVPGYSGDGGFPYAAQLNHPTRVFADNYGSIYIADFGNNRIRQIMSDSAYAVLGSISYVQNINADLQFHLYPNPATTSLTISSTNNINSITITNLLCQTVYTHKYNSEQVQVDVSYLPNGVYFIKVNGSAVRKFVKE
jgi:hypothetical protein